MVDGVLLLVDAVRRADAANAFRDAQGACLGLKPIVVINKIDRPGARPDWVINATFELSTNWGRPRNSSIFR